MNYYNSKTRITASTLGVLLGLAGGGIGHIILFLPIWAYATRINKSLE